MSTLIGLGGKLRAGKDAVGDYLASKHQYQKLGMSDALNEALQHIGPHGPWVKLDFTVLVDRPWEKGVRRGKYHKGEFVRYSELLSAVGYVEAKRHDDVRKYLQGLGTEVGRDMISQEVWVDIAEKRIRGLLDSGQSVVITAIRFPNELEMLRRLGGTSVWIERAEEARTDAEGDITTHASEMSVDAGMFDMFIANDGTLDDLYQLTENIVATGFPYVSDKHW